MRRSIAVECQRDQKASGAGWDCDEWISGEQFNPWAKRPLLAKLNLNAENLDGVRAVGRGILALRVGSVRRESDACPGFQEIRLRAVAAKRAEHCVRGEGRLRPRTGMSLFSLVQHRAERHRANC